LVSRKNKKGVVILTNNWDLVEKETNTMRDFEAMVRKQIQPFTDVPIIFTSVLTKQRIFKAIETAVEVFQNRKAKISTSKFNDTMLKIVKTYPPQQQKGNM
jgi:GTP-binding protein